MSLPSLSFFVTPNCAFAFLSVAPRGQRWACLNHHPRPESTRRRRGGRRGRRGRSGGGGGVVAPQNGFDRDRRISRRCHGLRVASEEGLEGKSETWTTLLHAVKQRSCPHSAKREAFTCAVALPAIPSPAIKPKPSSALPVSKYRTLFARSWEGSAPTVRSPSTRRSSTRSFAPPRTTTTTAPSLCRHGGERMRLCDGGVHSHHRI